MFPKFKILKAFPGDYSSMCAIKPGFDEPGLLVFGHGQTIHLSLDVKLIDKGEEIEFLYSPPSKMPGGKYYEFNHAHSRKSIKYSIEQGLFEGTENIGPHKYRYTHMVTFSNHPYPKDFSFSHELPTIFYAIL